MSVSLRAQRITYTLDTLKRDSVYLVERIEGAVTPENPRPQVLTTQRLFRSWDELDAFRKSLLDAEKQAREEAQKKAQTAAELRDRAYAIEGLLINSKSYWKR